MFRTLVTATLLAFSLGATASNLDNFVNALQNIRGSHNEGTHKTQSGKCRFGDTVRPKKTENYLTYPGSMHINRNTGDLEFYFECRVRLKKFNACTGHESDTRDEQRPGVIKGKVGLSLAGDIMVSNLHMAGSVGRCGNSIISQINQAAAAN